MDLHANAALSLNKRRQLARRVVEQRWTLTEAAEAAEVSVRCARKWVGRYRSEGELGHFDRSSAPRRVANRTAEERGQLCCAIVGLRDHEVIDALAAMHAQALHAGRREHREERRARGFEADARDLRVCAFPRLAAEPRVDPVGTEQDSLRGQMQSTADRAAALHAIRGVARDEGLVGIQLRRRAKPVARKWIGHARGDSTVRPRRERAQRAAGG